MPRLTEYADMNPRARAVVDGIAKARNIDPASINNVWKAMAKHPAVMEQFAGEMKAAMAPGKLDALTKELGVPGSALGGLTVKVEVEELKTRYKKATTPPPLPPGALKK